MLKIVKIGFLLLMCGFANAEEYLPPIVCSWNGSIVVTLTNTGNECCTFRYTCQNGVLTSVTKL